MMRAVAPGSWITWSVIALAPFAMFPASSSAHDDHGHKPAAGPTPILSAKSGNWSAADTWQGGKVPGEGARVLIASGHAVTYDVAADAVIRAINVAGTLRFAQDRNTKLNVGLIRVESVEHFTEEGFDCDAHPRAADESKPRAHLEVGAPNSPLPAKFQAVIRLHAVPGLDPKSCPAIVCCGGQMDFHGAPLSRTWVKLGESAAKGTKEVVLAEEVTGWKVGDQIVVSSTASGEDLDEGMSEQRKIVSIEGLKITFDEALEHPHLGTGEFRGEVANLSRNVVVESADPKGERGHTMYHKQSSGSISYAEFRHLGKKNVLGRYSLHFHLIGRSMRGSYVIGASIWDSHNRWLTIHGTNYLVVRDNVGYKSIGHGYFLEDGTEVFNVFDRNLAIGARAGKKLPAQVLPFDQNEGAGFWWANSLNRFTRNVAADNALYGFRYEATPTSALKLVLPVQKPDGTEEKTDIRTLPFVKFDSNEVHSNISLYGINLGEGVQRVGPDAQHPFIVRNTKIWHVHYGFRPQVPSLLVENLMIHEVAYGVYHPNFDNHVYRNVTIRRTNTEPFNRGHDDLSAQHGVLTVDGITFDDERSGGMPLIQISDDNPSGKAISHFRGVQTTNWKDGSREKAIANLGGGPRPTPRTEKGVPIYFHDWFGPGRHAMVVSIKSPEYKANPERFRSEPPLTGDESRVTEVKDIEFPTTLTPVDDLPPATVVTHIIPAGDKLQVRGVVSDNGNVKRVTVNGQSAKFNADGDFEIEIPRAAEIRAASEDEAGNAEKLPHVVLVK